MIGILFKLWKISVAQAGRHPCDTINQEELACRLMQATDNPMENWGLMALVAYFALRGIQ